MKKTLSVVAISLLGIAVSGGAAAQPTGNYAEDLGRVYEQTQFIRAVKEGCDGAHKDTTPANSAAYNSWRRRHKALLDELERRFLVLVHGASTDEKEYAKNVGKYGGAVVQYREELKGQFLSYPAEDVQRQCRGFPDFLRSDEADLEKRYVDELKSIRKRKL